MHNFGKRFWHIWSAKFLVVAITIIFLGCQREVNLGFPVVATHNDSASDDTNSESDSSTITDNMFISSESEVDATATTRPTSD